MNKKDLLKIRRLATSLKNSSMKRTSWFMAFEQIAREELNKGTRIVLEKMDNELKRQAGNPELDIVEVNMLFEKIKESDPRFRAKLWQEYLSVFANRPSISKEEHDFIMTSPHLLPYSDLYRFDNQEIYVRKMDIDTALVSEDLLLYSNMEPIFLPKSANIERMEIKVPLQKILTAKK